MSTYYRHPGYDPPGFTEHIARHQREAGHVGFPPLDVTFGNDRIEACSICDPMIEAQRYMHNKQVERDEIEAPLLARIAELEAQLRENTMKFWRKREYPPWMPPLHCPQCGKNVAYWICSVSVDTDNYSTSKIRAEVVSDHACKRNEVRFKGNVT